MSLKQAIAVPLLLLGLAASCQSPDGRGQSTVAHSDASTTTPAVTSTAPAPTVAPTRPAAIDTAALVAIPNPLAEDNPRYAEEDLAVPIVGETFQDAGLGTSAARVTEQPGIRHEYSRFDPLNADESMILLLDVAEGSFLVYRTVPPYDRPQNFVRELELESPRWDRDAPNLVTGLSGFRIVSVDVLTGEEQTIKDFAADPTIGPLIAADGDLYRVTMKYEGEPSLDGDWWALALQGTREDYRLRYLFCWHKSSDEVTGLYELAGGQAEIDWLGMSPLGTWVLIGAEPYTDVPFTGFTIANRELTEFHRVNYDTGHADVGLDVNGHEVLVMQNSQTDRIDLIPLTASTESVTETGEGYKDSDHIPLVRLYYDSESPLGFNCGTHVSCNAPGYALISTHQEPGIPEQNWLDRSIILVRLDPSDPRACYVAKIHNLTQEYWEETHATISSSGRTVLWAANFGVDVGEERVYLLRLDLPRPSP